MRVIRRISAVLVGFVLFLSGVLKLMDPVGARLVVEEYLRFLHLDFLSGLSGVIGSGMALLEALLGAALITGVWRKLTAIVTGAILAFFTVLTVLLVIWNPLMDCGCFGEIVHLTHLQSLLKNIVLLALWALACLPLGAQEPTRKVKYVSFPIVAISVCLFLLYSSLSIPLVDFTPFKPGAELMLPEDIDDPLDDRTPTLSVSDASGQYVDSLMVSGKLMAVSVYEPGKIGPQGWEKIAGLMRNATDLGYNPVVLAAATPEMMESLTSAPEILGSTYFADRKKLLTLNRSNGGATYIQDGLIVTKWSIRRLPDRDKLSDLAAIDVTESLLSENNGDRLKFQAFLLYVFAVMLLL
ncbi:MAG: hypothetical protein K5910_04335 [Bacteroidales bacterium]|nr:hypothetical protein [Bacteroidales bacterium]